jgi:hypothetical protein
MYSSKRSDMALDASYRFVLFLHPCFAMHTLCSALCGYNDLSSLFRVHIMNIERLAKWVYSVEQGLTRFTKTKQSMVAARK